MLNREDIIKIIEELDLPKSEYWVTSGSALVLHKVKKTAGDIDLGCTDKLWRDLLKKGYTFRLENDNSKIIKVNENVEIIYEYFVDEIELIKEIPTGSLASIKKQKAKLGREKDILDIKLIDEFTQNK